MALKYDVVAVTGTYMKDGEEKKRYQKIGVILTTQRGSFMLKLESIPVGWDGAAFLNDPRQSDEKPASRPAPKPKPSADDDSDIPF